jgi:hypothetical protein
MKTKLLISFFLFFAISMHAQLEKVIVEKYYVSDNNDATDTAGGTFVKPHSTTYRVYIDLAKGYKLTRIYGNASHELKISSDSIFFNRNSQTADGQTFAYNFNVLRFSEGTVPLDTWLTLGEVSQSNTSGKTYFGVLKRSDKNGSIIGGKNNDGGSANIQGGLLVNNDTAAGIPLTTADGIDTMGVIPTGWFTYGIVDFASGNDSTIFGSIVKSNLFKSNNAVLTNNGVMGVNRDTNQVLVAQLTTQGKLSFELNVEIVDSSGTIAVDYVAIANRAGDSTQLANNGNKVIQSNWLIFPQPCGCTNPNYFEYNPEYDCLDPTACKTLVVLGCMDSLACNYDPKANSNVQSLCCYPGYCNNLDISVVCPVLNVEALNNTNTIGFDIFPNPVQDRLNLTITGSNNKEIGYEIIDMYGRLISKKDICISTVKSTFQIDVSGFISGLYTIRLIEDNSSVVKKFIKN